MMAEVTTAVLTSRGRPPKAPQAHLVVWAGPEEEEKGRMAGHEDNCGALGGHQGVGERSREGSLAGARRWVLNIGMARSIPEALVLCEQVAF